MKISHDQKFLLNHTNGRFLVTSSDCCQNNRFINYTRFINYSSVAGLVELHVLPHVSSHVERGGPRLALRVHLQGYVRHRGAAQQVAGDLHRISHINHLARIYLCVHVPFLLPSVLYYFRRNLYSNLVQRLQQHQHVGELLHRHRHSCQPVCDRILCPLQLFAIFRLLCGLASTAKLELSEATCRVGCSYSSDEFFSQDNLFTVSEKLLVGN